MASRTNAGGVRLLLEVHRSGGGSIAGSVTRQDTGDRWGFSGWLELLRLLEAAITPPERHGGGQPPDPGPG
jgi:hypothetical protein